MPALNVGDLLFDCSGGFAHTNQNVELIQMLPGLLLTAPVPHKYGWDGNQQLWAANGSEVGRIRISDGACEMSFLPHDLLALFGHPAPDSGGQYVYIRETPEGPSSFYTSFGIAKYTPDGMFVSWVPSGDGILDDENFAGANALDLHTDDCTLYAPVEGAGSVESFYRLDGCALTRLSDFPGSWNGILVWHVIILPDGGLLTAEDGNLRRRDSSGSTLWTFNDSRAWLGCDVDPDGTTFWAATNPAFAAFPNNVSLIGHFALSDGSQITEYDPNVINGGAIGFTGGNITVVPNVTAVVRRPFLYGMVIG